MRPGYLDGKAPILDQFLTIGLRLFILDNEFDHFLFSSMPSLPGSPATAVGNKVR